LERTRKPKKDNRELRHQRAKEVLKEGRKANILWQCNLEEKEEAHLHPIGEVNLPVQDRALETEIENPDIKSTFSI
jgi:hypothetical protein